MDPALATMIRNLESQSGRSLQDWIVLINGSGLAKHGEIVKLLKTEHGLGHGYANMLVHMAKNGIPGESEVPPEEAEAALFAGKKEALAPIYAALREAIVGLGDDVEVAPKKTYVSFRRAKQFALAQPSTATRLDLGLNLKGVPEAGRLQSAAGFNAMCSHRVRLAEPSDVDADVVGWLRQAYEQSAGNRGK